VKAKRAAIQVSLVSFWFPFFFFSSLVLSSWFLFILFYLFQLEFILHFQTLDSFYSLSHLFTLYLDHFTYLIFVTFLGRSFTKQDPRGRLNQNFPFLTKLTWKPNFCWGYFDSTPLKSYQATCPHPSGKGETRYRIRCLQAEPEPETGPHVPRILGCSTGNHSTGERESTSARLATHSTEDWNSWESGGQILWILLKVRSTICLPLKEPRLWFGHK